MCTQEPDARPVLERERDGQYRLRYAGVDEAFCVRVYGERRRERLLETGSLEDALISRLSNPDHTFDDVLNPFSGSFRRKHSDPGWYQKPAGERAVPAARGLPYRIRRALGHAPGRTRRRHWSRCSARASAGQKLPAFNPAGRRYRLSVRCLRAAALTNVVYPLYRRVKWWRIIRRESGGILSTHGTPASSAWARHRRTQKLGRRVLEQYLSGLENSDFAFVHHGSLVPVQFYLYQDLLARAQDKAGLLRLYPAMRRYYEFWPDGAKAPRPRALQAAC